MPFETVEEIPPDVDAKYRRTSPTSFACRTCATNVLSVEVQRPLGGVHEPTVVPYCPKCEAVPVDEGPPRPAKTRDTSWDR